MNSIHDVWRVARPLLFDSGDATYPLWGKGSCFLLNFRGDLWVVTAKHALQNNPAFQARVLRSMDRRRPKFIELAEVLIPDDRDRYDDAWLDMILIRGRRPVPDEFVVDLDTTTIAPFGYARQTDYVRIPCMSPVLS